MTRTVRDRKKDLPKRVDMLTLPAPHGIRIIDTTDANKTKEESEKKTGTTLQGVTLEGVSIN